MQRTYLPYLKKYLHKKIILLSGPRQSGKTTLSKMLVTNYDYLNFDFEGDRKRLKEMAWDRSKDLVIFDEIHKKPKWKQWLKGIYDKEGIPPSMVVTGSARLDSYRKMGDSLAGRYFPYRLHPLDVREILALNPKSNPQTTVQNLLCFGGFPEPYLEQSEEFYQLWKKTHLDIILRQDLIDLETVRNIKQIELLIDLLSERVGAPTSHSSLARELQVSDKTVKKWLELLEDLYVIFKVTPYSKNIAKSILKMPKYYFYDIARVIGESQRLENLVASSLLKETHFRQDCLGKNYQLYYLSKKGEAELDFFIQGPKKDDNYLIEVKQSDTSVSPQFSHFKDHFKNPKMIQLVMNIRQEKTYPSGVEVRELSKWLCSW